VTCLKFLSRRAARRGRRAHGDGQLGASGKLLHWDRTNDLAKIAVPTLVIGARHDTMDPDHMAWMAGALGRGATY